MGLGYACENHLSDPRRPGEASVKIVQDEQQAQAEKKRLEAEGFVVIEITKLRPGWTDLA